MSIIEWLTAAVLVNQNRNLFGPSLLHFQDVRLQKSSAALHVPPPLPTDVLPSALY